MRAVAAYTDGSAVGASDAEVASLPIVPQDRAGSGDRDTSTQRYSSPG